MKHMGMVTKGRGRRRRVMAFSALALTLVLCLCLISSASASPLVKVEVTNTTSEAYESLTVLNPGDENWIEIVGGEEVSLPIINIVYNIKSTNYTKGDKKIKIIPYVEESEDYSVHYPFSKHSVYYNGDGVEVKVLGERGIAGEKAHVYLIKTCPSELNSMWNSAFDGDMKPLRDLLDNSIEEQEITLDSAGDCTASFGTLNPGDYAVVAALNESTAQNITFISTTAFEVIEHKSTLEVLDVEITRKSASDYTFVSGDFTIIGADANATYTYIVALLRKDEKFDLRWDCDETKSELNLKLSDAPLTESINIFGGIGLGNLNATNIYDWIKSFQTASVEKGESGNTYYFEMPVMDMPDGDYYLYAMACNLTSPARKTFASAVAQKEVKIETLVKQKLGISLTAYPETIEANGVDTSTITAFVTDEFGGGVNGTEVTFSTRLGTIEPHKTETTTDGFATTILTSSTFPGTAVVEANAFVNGIPVSDTVSVIFTKTAEAECNETMGDLTITVDTVTVANTTVTVKDGVITINTTIPDDAEKIEANATADSTIYLAIKGGTLEITMKEDAIASDGTVTGHISKIKLDTLPESYNASKPYVGDVTADLDVEFKGDFTPANLTFSMTMRDDIEDVADLISADARTVEDNLLAAFGLAPTAENRLNLLDNTPVLIHAELSATNLTAADVTCVPISITVNRAWFDTVAGGDPSNVTMFKINGTTGEVEKIKLTEASITVNDGTVTFHATFDHFCVFAIAARPLAAVVAPVIRRGTPTPTPTPIPPVPRDTTAPIISNVTVTIERYVIISWDTNEKSDSLVKCGMKSRPYTIEEYLPKHVLFHTITLKQIRLSKIYENTTYYFVVNSTDPSGNSAQTGKYMFVLTPPEKRAIMPFILQIPITLYTYMWWILPTVILVLIIIIIVIPRYKSKQNFNSLTGKPVRTEILMYLYTIFPNASRPADISKNTNVNLNGVLEALHTISNKNRLESLLGIGLVDKVECEGGTCYCISKRGKLLMEEV